MNTPAPTLEHYFRKPEIIITLPSKGKFYPPGSIELGASGELEILPMTGKDELMFKTPDALIGGISTFRVIESCIPQIKNAEDIPVIDLDTILIAIRIATYGKDMEIKVICPKCATENEYDIDLSYILGTLPTDVEFNDTIKLDNGLTITIKPLHYKIMNDNLIKEYEKNKAIAVLSNENMTEKERMQQFYDMMLFITETSIDTIVQCIIDVTTEQGDVITDKKAIQELIENLNLTNFNVINDQIILIKTTSKQITVPGICTNEECKHEWDVPLTFDMSNFFG